MLTKGEPYRYAPPQTTAAKDRRRNNCRPPDVEHPGALVDVYHNEGLPARSNLAAGELRHLTETHTLQFAKTLSNPQRVPRNTGKPRGQSRKNMGRLPETILPEK